MLALDGLEMLPHGAYLGLSNLTIKAALDEAGVEVDTSSPLRLVIALKRGESVFTKVTRVHRNGKGIPLDIAVINGDMYTPETEVPF